MLFDFQRLRIDVKTKWNGMNKARRVEIDFTRQEMINIGSKQLNRIYAYCFRNVIGGMK